MAQQSSRDPWFDNAKMALVTLVVIGHAWAPIQSIGAAEYLYDFVYLWHMPAFVLVTGYLSRSFSYHPDRIWQLFRTVAVPYLIFESALALFRVYVGGEELGGLFIDPHWPMWFLVALFCWRLATPLFLAMPAAGAVGTGVLISLSAGFWAGSALDLSRVMGFLPFFVLGLCLTPERLEVLRSTKAARAAVAAFALIAVVALVLDSVIATEWLYHRSRYAELGTGPVEAVLIRGALLGLGTLGAFAFLAVLPRARGWFTAMGSASLIVYLGHGFFLKALEYAGVAGWAHRTPVVGFLAVTAAGLLLALLLAWKPLARRLQHLVDPFGKPEQELRAAVRLARTAEQAVALEASSRDPRPVTPVAR